MFLRTFVIVLILFAVFSCKQVDFTAVDGSEIRLTAQPLSINKGATSTLTVTGTRDNGAPLPDGTVIRFTVSENLGQVTPNPAETTNGIVTATFIAGQRSGTTVITALSGAVSSEDVSIDIGEARISQLILTADPASLPPEGGKVNLRAYVRDEDGNPVSAVQVFFSTDAGSLSSHGDPVLTNASGLARDTLNTDQEANITATAGDVDDQLSISLGSTTAPVCGFVVAPTSAAVGQDISFADDSTAGDSPLRTSTWDFGDGKSDNGFVVTDSYSSEGTFIILHTIIDTQGLSDNCTPIVVDVQPGQPPTCSFDIAPTGDVDVGEQVSFADTSTDSDGQITSSTWDFGDDQTAAGSSVTHTYTTAGSFIVQHTAFDDQGLSSSCTSTINVLFVGTPPTCRFLIEPVVPGSFIVTFDASASTDTDENGSSITTYDWDFGDSKTSSEPDPIVNHTYATSGTFTVVLTVTDDEGAKATCATQQVTVPGT